MADAIRLAPEPEPQRRKSPASHALDRYAKAWLKHPANSREGAWLLRAFKSELDEGSGAGRERA